MPMNKNSLVRFGLLRALLGSGIFQKEDARLCAQTAADLLLPAQLDQAGCTLSGRARHSAEPPFRLGFRVAQLYGLDYRFTTAKGYFSSKLLQKNNQYGYDPVMAYVDLYGGQIFHGLNVRMGRYISLPDIEAQLAPDNYTYSHSLLYTFDAYTQTGINVTAKLTGNWTVQVGLSAGNTGSLGGRARCQAYVQCCVGYT